jgi:hypothetical protein
LALAAACGAPFASVAAAAPDAHDFPTVERVNYVESCMRDHPGPHYEMINKCSCVIDTIARDVTFDEYDTMNTATNAATIGGERGGVIRDVEVMQKEIRKFKTLQAAARKSCLLQPPEAK